jgi:hypothetical protein
MIPSPGLTNQSLAPASVADTADQIHELVAAEFTLQETGGTLTADGNEQTLYINDTPLGCFEPRVVFVDLDNMQGGDTVEFKVYYRIKSQDVHAGALKLQSLQNYTGIDGGLANNTKVIAIDLYPNRFGIEVTLQQTAGTNRIYDWQVFVEE